MLEVLAFVMGAGSKTHGTGLVLLCEALAHKPSLLNLYFYHLHPEFYFAAPMTEIRDGLNALFQPFQFPHCNKKLIPRENISLLVRYPPLVNFYNMHECDVLQQDFLIFPLGFRESRP
jgi:hypothetical protein